MACSKATGSIILTALISLAIGSGGLAAPAGSTRSFSDLQTHWARSDVEQLAQLGVVEGRGGGRFEPERAVTRAEMVRMLVAMLDRDPARKPRQTAPSTPTFADVPPEAWYYDAVESAAANGLVTGAEGRFRPDDPVTREEMAAMVLRAMGLEAAARASVNAALPYTDAGQVSSWAKGYVALVWQKGLMNGVGGGAFAPGDAATRAQAASLVLRAMERLGLASDSVTLTGTLAVSEIEGRHLELEVTEGGSVIRYVLSPMDATVARMLEGGVGRRVRLTGLLDDRHNIYMRGPVLRVLEVAPAP